MSLRLKMAIVFIIILFLFPRNVKAGEQSYNIFQEEEEKQVWDEKNMIFEDGLDQTEKAYLLFVEMFKAMEEDGLFPRDTKILTAKVNKQHLVLNISEEAMDYGEKYFDQFIKEKIFETALHFPNIKMVTLLIDNANKYPPRGCFEKSIYK